MAPYIGPARQAFEIIAIQGWFIHSIELQRTLMECVLAADNPGQGRLADTGRTEQGMESRLVDFEIEVLEQEIFRSRMSKMNVMAFQIHDSVRTHKKSSKLSLT
jgi:hypothetical protein